MKSEASSAALLTPQHQHTAVLHKHTRRNRRSEARTSKDLDPNHNTFDAQEICRAKPQVDMTSRNWSAGGNVDVDVSYKYLTFFLEDGRAP